MSDHLQSTVEALFEKSELSPEDISVVNEAINLIDQGQIRVAEPTDPNESQWKVNEWVKKAILLYFKTQKMGPIKAGDLSFFDKIPLKKWTGSEGVRVVPHAMVRKGAFVESGAVLMPSYVNIGAFVGSGTLVDTWATVGSCAQVGKNVHISGGVGLGGVLEPLQASPVIIEDDVFLGPSCVLTNVTNPRSQVVRHNLFEKTIFRRGATVGANATVVCGIELGRYCMIAAGAVVTKDVPDYALMVGVPGRQVGWVSRHGILLDKPGKDGIMVCPESGYRYKEMQPGNLRCLDLDEEAPLPKDKAVGTKSYDYFKQNTFKFKEKD